MPTPSDGYKLRDGRSVPGATTIADYFKDSPAVNNLISWGRSMGKKGLSWETRRDAAGAVGTEIHRMVEQHIRGLGVAVERFPPGTEDNAAAWRGFGGFKKWIAPLKIEFLRDELERQFVSEAKEYGGTPDAFGLMEGGGLTLFDWKTGSYIYKSALRQTAAYRNLWDENRPDNPITNGAYVVRFDKKTGGFSWNHFSNAELDVGFESFLGFYEEMRRDRALEIILERSRSRA